ncbi:hypothetical protein PENARI_c001G05846 [Penicillium arizonense]|uniref:Uncharacterized protein n=1 Tax=Penicillium arizonense TaxID=1835702 RepID=A0A1F5LYK8_PENAI|nr:hypothetical protein PENARI_c001G05846 [Penicillium arizonense]OGE58257.1 hypothetical protein PENARI_c001G05846 [Penicillium arizonense]
MSSGYNVIHFAHAENVRIRIPEDGMAVPMNYYFGSIGCLMLDTNINPGSINIFAGNIRIIHNWAETGIGAITVSAENIEIVFHYYHTGSQAVSIDAANIDMIYNHVRSTASLFLHETCSCTDTTEVPGLLARFVDSHKALERIVEPTMERNTLYELNTL